VGAAALASRAARPVVLTAVSEWALDEVMVTFGLSAAAACGLLAESITLVERLPSALDALETGALSRAHARMLAEVLAPLPDQAVRAEVERRRLARAEGRTVAQLRGAARRAVLRADDSAAVGRLAAAVRDRAVRVHPGEDGMGTLSATMPLPVALACTRVLEAYAEECAVPGDEPTKDQRMVDCLADLLLRPNDPDRPPVQARLTIVAGVDTLTGGTEPGEVEGRPVPALLVRELAHALGLLPRPDRAEEEEIARPRRRNPRPRRPRPPCPRLRRPRVRGPRRGRRRQRRPRRPRRPLLSPPPNHRRRPRTRPRARGWPTCSTSAPPPAPRRRSGPRWR
jgi:hypothetical protein